MSFSEAAPLYWQLRRRGFTLALDGDRLIVEHASGKLSDTEIARIRECKPDLICYVQSHTPPCRRCGAPTRKSGYLYICTAGCMETTMGWEESREY